MTETHGEGIGQSQHSEQQIDAILSKIAESIKVDVLGKKTDSFDILTFANLQAGFASATYFNAKMSKATNVDSDLQLLSRAMEQRTVPGLIMEFGVAAGRTINHISSLTDQPVYGFDNFAGLPETWRTGFGAGSFRREVPAVNGNVELVVGLFDDTLGDFLDRHDGPVSLLHVDCDLYSGAKTIFDELAPRIVPGTVIVFDEYFNYPGWEHHEFKAFHEFVAANDISYRYDSFVSRHQQVCVVIEQPGRSNDGSHGAVSEPGNWLARYFDDLTAGPLVWKWEHYFPIYERHFAKFRGKEVHILEIGVLGGGSLKMWEAYFGPNVHIYGVDISPQCMAQENDRTRIFIGDQADKNFWANVMSQVPRLDIIVDDGGHQAFQQIATVEALLPYLAPGGVYLCEDLYGEANPFLDYLDKFSRDLHAWRPINAAPIKGRAGQVVPPHHLLETSDLQKSINSIHLYPFAAVIEIRDRMLTNLVAPQHGEWHVP